MSRARDRASVRSWFLLILALAVLSVAMIGGAKLSLVVTGTEENAAERFNSTATQTPDNLQWYNKDFNKTEVRQHFVREYNQHRSERQLPDVMYWEPLTEMGEKQSEHMIENGYFSHTRPDGTTMEDRFNQRNLFPECHITKDSDSYYTGAENLGMGYLGKPMNVSYMNLDVVIESEEELADHLFDQWFFSTPHRESMMQRDIGTIGLGLAVNQTGAVYASLEMCGN